MTQYGVSLRNTDIEWDEFSVLLSGILPETPLGKIIEIRSEDDKDVLKHFSPQQKEIRNKWRLRQSQEYIDSLTEEEKKEMVSGLQDMFSKAFK